MKMYEHVCMENMFNDASYPVLFNMRADSRLQNVANTIPYCDDGVSFQSELIGAKLKGKK